MAEENIEVVGVEEFARGVLAELGGMLGKEEFADLVEDIPVGCRAVPEVSAGIARIVFDGEHLTDCAGAHADFINDGL